MGTGPAPSPLLVGLATLGLLADNAKRRPLLVSVDDVQWLDRESVDVIGFLGRRIRAEGIALLLATRSEASDLAQLATLPVLDITGLAEPAALQLLRSVAGNRVEPRIAQGIVTATGGNPLALVDLRRELSTHQLVGGTLLPEPIPVGSRLETHYQRQLEALPADTQTSVLLAAAEPTGDAGYLAAATRRWGATKDASLPAEQAGLVILEPDCRFRHPLVRSAVYNGATDTERRRAHHVLAAAGTRSGDEDQRAWHLASAAPGPDEFVAEDLELAAERAAARGGYAARASFWARAAELSDNGPERARRLIEAAEAALASGAFVQTQACLTSSRKTGWTTSSEAGRW